MTVKIHEIKTGDEVIGAVACYYVPGEYLGYYTCFFDSEGEDGTTGWNADDETGAGLAFGLIDSPPMRMGDTTLPEGIPDPPPEEEVIAND